MRRMGRVRGAAKLAVLVVITIPCVPPLWAQEVTAGLKGGPGFTNLKVQEDVFSLDMDGRTSFVGGGFVRVELSPVLSLQPEVLWARKGAEVTLEELTVGFRFDYLEIPLLLVRRIPVWDGPTTPFLLAGPALAYQTGCRIDLQEGAFVLGVACDDPDVEFDRRRTDVGLVLGGGLELDARGAMLTFEARYHHGLGNVDRDPNGTIRNRAFSVLAGVGIQVR